MLADSMAMPSYNSVRTLWWIAKDIDRYVSGEDEHDAKQGESDRHCSGNRIPGRPKMRFGNSRQLRIGEFIPLQFH